MISDSQLSVRSCLYFQQGDVSRVILAAKCWVMLFGDSAQQPKYRIHTSQNASLCRHPRFLPWFMKPYQAKNRRQLVGVAVSPWITSQQIHNNSQHRIHCPHCNFHLSMGLLPVPWGTQPFRSSSEGPLQTSKLTFPFNF